MCFLLNCHSQWGQLSLFHYSLNDCPITLGIITESSYTFSIQRCDVALGQTVTQNEKVAFQTVTQNEKVF